MKPFFLLLGVCFIRLASFSQEADTITLVECYSLARQHYPMAKQKELIEKSNEYSLSNAAKGYLPRLSLNGQATIQSDVTQVSIPIPNLNIPSPNKDQYKIYGELSQPLTDATIIKQQKQMIGINSGVEEQKLEVELYKLKERINQLFFGILMAEEQLALIELMKKDLQDGISKVSAAIENGMATNSNADVLKAELLRADQRSIEFRAARGAYLEMLGLFINRQLANEVKLEKPMPVLAVNTISRPELVLFDSQKKTLDIRDKLLKANSYPRANLFLQSGFGRPALNMFSTDFDFYYIGGIRLSWQLSSFYTLKKERQLISISRQLFDNQKEIFLFNTNLLLKQQSAEINKLNELIGKDNEIIALRVGIKNSASSQLENGVITAPDYLREVNAEDQARQSLLMHETLLLMTHYSFKTIAGN